MFTRHLANHLIKRTFFKKHNYAKPVKEQRITPQERMWSLIEDQNIQSNSDWKYLRNEILAKDRLVTASNIDALTVGICTKQKKYDMAFSYLAFLKNENIPINLGTIGKQFRLFYEKYLNQGLSDSEVSQILILYENVRKSYPVLDSGTLSHLIEALSVTKEWKKCIELLEEMKILSKPHAPDYNVVIAAAFRNDCEDLAWKYMKELLGETRTVSDMVFDAYFERIKNKILAVVEFEKLFNFLQQNFIQISPPVLIDWLKKFDVHVVSSTVDNRGFCKQCNQFLQKFDLSDEEFNELKTKMVENVIIGKDVFQKTTPQELQAFKSFIGTMKSFDVVVDGLNVAYSVGVRQSTSVMSGLVAAVVSHFVAQNKSVLVLGRKHMNQWSNQNWSFVRKNATLFLTDNLSSDDPYLLYCALNSGKNTIIVTKDLMRSHKFLLKETYLKSMFERWLSQRQYFLVNVKNQNTPIFKKPPVYSVVAQKNGNHWHVPCLNDDMNILNRFLCIKL